MHALPSHAWTEPSGVRDEPNGERGARGRAPSPDPQAGGTAAPPSVSDSMPLRAYHIFVASFVVSLVAFDADPDTDPDADWVAAGLRGGSAAGREEEIAKARHNDSSCLLDVVSYSRKQRAVAIFSAFSGLSSRVTISRAKGTATPAPWAVMIRPSTHTD